MCVESGVFVVVCGWPGSQMRLLKFADRRRPARRRRRRRQVPAGGEKKPEFDSGSAFCQKAASPPPSSSSLLLLRLLSSSPALFGTCAKLSSLPLPPLLPLLLSAFLFPLPSSLLLVSSSPLFLLPSSSSSPLVFFPRLLLFSSSQDIAPGKKRKRARRQLLQGLGRSPRSQTPSTVSKSETTTPAEVIEHEIIPWQVSVSLGKTPTSPPVRWSRVHPQPGHPTEADLLLSQQEISQPSCAHDESDSDIFPKVARAAAYFRCRRGTWCGASDVPAPHLMRAERGSVPVSWSAR